MTWGGGGGLPGPAELEEALDDLEVVGWAVVDTSAAAQELEELHGRALFAIPVLEPGVLEPEPVVVVVDPWRLGEVLAESTSLAESTLFPSLQPQRRS